MALVETITLAAAAGVSQQRISRLTKAGILTAYRPRLGRPGRPSCWYDLDVALAALAEHANSPRLAGARDLTTHAAAVKVISSLGRL